MLSTALFLLVVCSIPTSLLLLYLAERKYEPFKEIPCLFRVEDLREGLAVFRRLPRLTHDNDAATPPRATHLSSPRLPPPLPKAPKMLTTGSSLQSTLLPKAQFRAVILCGYGSDLYPLIEPTSGAYADGEGGADGGAAGLPGKGPGQVKALLPVAGKRMLDWVLERVEDAGVFGELSEAFPEGNVELNGPPLLRRQTFSSFVQVLSMARWPTISGRGGPARQLACL